MTELKRLADHIRLSGFKTQTAYAIHLTNADGKKVTQQQVSGWNKKNYIVARNEEGKLILYSPLRELPEIRNELEKEQ